MAQVTQNSIDKDKVQDLFDQVLGQHMDRLIGTSYGIGAMPLNPATISYLMLLMERENEIESFPSDPPERYTAETLGNEFGEMGFGLDQDMALITQDMIEKGYVYVENDGRLIPEKPAKSMAQLLDRAFPGMPGMNLVAYFIQTLHEVKSERKDLDSAVSQFDQMLQMQGVPLKKGAPQPEQEGVSSSSVGQKTHPQKSEAVLKHKEQIAQEEGIKHSEILGRSRSKTWSETRMISSPEPKILSSDTYKKKFEVKEVNFGRPLPQHEEPVEIVPDPDEKIENEEPATELTPPSEPQKAGSLETDHDTQYLPDLDDVAALLETPIQDTESAGQTTDILPEVQAEEETKDQQGMIPEKEVSDRADDDIEKRIAAFQEDLSMECPMCKNSTIKAEETAINKQYYSCSNKTCNFISWGKPYHILCPTCNNPFLIEASDRGGKTILKCPRSTCRYWQKPPWEVTEDRQTDAYSQETKKTTAVSKKPLRKVVRRRRVRRKK